MIDKNDIYSRKAYELIFNSFIEKGNRNRLIDLSEFKDDAQYKLFRKLEELYDEFSVELEKIDQQKDLEKYQDLKRHFEAIKNISESSIREVALDISVGTTIRTIADLQRNFSYKMFKSRIPDLLSDDRLEFNKFYNDVVGYLLKYKSIPTNKNYLIMEQNDVTTDFYSQFIFQKKDNKKNDYYSIELKNTFFDNEMTIPALSVVFSLRGDDRGLLFEKGKKMLFYSEESAKNSNISFNDRSEDAQIASVKRLYNYISYSTTSRKNFIKKLNKLIK